MSDQDSARTLSNGQQCAYAGDEGRPEWHEHDHDMCLETDEAPAVPLEEALAGPVAESRAAREAAGEQVAGLRAMADMIERNPHLAPLLRYSLDGILVSLVGEPGDKAALMAQFITAALPSGAKATKDAQNKYFRVLLKWGPVALDVYAEREQVCERVVVGTEQVTKTGKDPEAVAALPDVQITETVEQVKWVCRPLLAAPGEAGAL